MTGVRVTFTIPEIDELKARWAKAPALVERETHTAMRKAVMYTEGQVKLLTPVVKGTLRRSVRSNATSAGPAVLGVVFSNKNYAAAVEKGARARFIRPVKKKALYWKGAKHPVRRVWWPGFTGRFMFRKGLSKSKTQIQVFFSEALARVARFMDGE